MTFYVDDFFLLYMANLLNLVSPGAGFAITVRNSTAISRKAGLMTGAGIVCSSVIHKSYTLLGFGLIVSQTPWLFQLIKYAGCAYLFYLGVKCFWDAMAPRIQKKILVFLPFGLGSDHTKPDHFTLGNVLDDSHMTQGQAFRMGFLTDMLNPQASLCFIAIVAATIRPETPLLTQGFYGLTLISTSVVWYTLVALFFSHPLLIEKFYNARPWIKRLIGASLVYFACKLLLTPSCAANFA